MGQSLAKASKQVEVAILFLIGGYNVQEHFYGTPSLRLSSIAVSSSTDQAAPGVLGMSSKFAVKLIIHSTSEDGVNKHLTAFLLLHFHLFLALPLEIFDHVPFTSFEQPVSVYGLMSLNAQHLFQHLRQTHALQTANALEKQAINAESLNGEHVCNMEGTRKVVEPLTNAAS